jgi:hypothetical protein
MMMPSVEKGEKSRARHARKLLLNNKKGTTMSNHFPPFSILSCLHRAQKRALQSLILIFARRLPPASNTPTKSNSGEGASTSDAENKFPPRISSRVEEQKKRLRDGMYASYVSGDLFSFTRFLWRWEGSFVSPERDCWGGWVGEMKKRSNIHHNRIFLLCNILRWKFLLLLGC